MCQSIAWGDEELTTQGDLAAEIPPDRWLHKPEYQERARRYDPDTCLCPVDVRATLEAAGHRVRVGWETTGTDWEVVEPQGR